MSFICREIINIYEEWGMSRADTALVVETISEYKQFFIDVMTKEEIEMQVPKYNHAIGSMKEGVAMFFSFVVFDSFPLVGYVMILI